MFKVLLLTLVVILSSINALDFPRLPDAYTTGIEVKSNMETNHIIYTAREYRMNNKYSYYFDSQRTSNTTGTPIKSTRNMAVFFDFDQGVAKIIDTTGGRKKCRHTYNSSRHTKDVAQLQRSPAATTSQLIGDVQKNNYSYEGESVIRNLSCQQWKRQEGNETIDYYFFALPSGDMKLIRIVESNTDFHRHSIYDYFGFRKLVPTLEELQPPLGTYCANITSDKTIPEVADQMTFNVEYRPIRIRTLANYSNTWLAVNYKIYWDVKKDITRNDHHIKENGKWVPVKDIMDYNKGILYESFSPMKCRNKTIEEFAVTRYPYFKSKRHWVRAREAFLHLKEFKSDYKYEGEHFVRGVPCDVWIYKSDQLGQDGFNEIEWYFTQPNVTEISSLGNLREKQVPVRVVGYYGNKTKESFEMEIYDYRHEVTDEDFENPIRDCLKVNGQVYTIQLFVLGIPFKKISTIITPLKEAILNSIQDLTNMKENGRFLMEMLTSDDHLNILLSIVPVQNENLNDLYQIANKIEDAIKRKTLKFNYRVVGNDKIQMGYFANDFIDFEQARCSFRGDDNKNDDVAILIVFIFVALVVGFFIAVVALNSVLAKNGHNLKIMIRKREKMDDEGISSRATFSKNNNGDKNTPRQTEESVVVEPLPSPPTPPAEPVALQETQTAYETALAETENIDKEMENIPI